MGLDDYKLKRHKRRFRNIVAQGWVEELDLFDKKIDSIKDSLELFDSELKKH